MFHSVICIARIISKEYNIAMSERIDVTAEYLENAIPGEGSVIIETGYDESQREVEVKMAKWIHKTFGGNIILLKETDKVYEGKRADYLWRDRLWELKNTGSAKSVDSVLRKALKQIRENPGGVIIDFGKSKDSIARIESAISERIRKSCRFSIDVMVLKHGKVVKVIRYKK